MLAHGSGFHDVPRPAGDSKTGRMSKLLLGLMITVHDLSEVPIAGIAFPSLDTTVSEISCRVDLGGTDGKTYSGEEVGVTEGNTDPSAEKEGLALGDLVE
jgi:hypothetical protein